MAARKNHKAGFAVAGLFAAAGLGAWLLFSLSTEPAATSREAKGESRTPDVGLPLAVPAPEEQPVAPSKPESILVEAEVHAHTEAHHPEPLPPSHPMVEKRLWLNEQNELIRRADDAMSMKRPAVLREVLAEYRAHDPNDVSRLQTGYALIADCMDTPGPESRARAERFVVEQRASTLRRFVRRYCIGDR
jgi:hypothetical protein